MARTLIKNGTVVSPTGRTLQDVLIDGEVIVALGSPGYFAGSEEGCDRVIDAAGGARAWLAAGLDAPQPDESEGDLVNRELWRTFAQASTSLPPIHLGYGLSDRFAPAHRRFAELLPAERVSTAPGGHDWRAWRALWEAWLGQGLLAQPLGAPARPTGAAA